MQARLRLSNKPATTLPSWIEERAQIKPIVVWAVRLGVVGRSERSHLVAIDGIRAEEVLDFDSNLACSKDKPP